jgi:hypothetical protein
VLEKVTTCTACTEPTRLPDKVTLSMQRKLRVSMTVECKRALTRVVTHHCLKEKTVKKQQRVKRGKQCFKRWPSHPEYVHVQPPVCRPFSILQW